MDLLWLKVLLNSCMVPYLSFINEGLKFHFKALTGTKCLVVVECGWVVF